MPRYRSARSGAIYSHSAPIRPEDVEVEESTERPPRHDERLEALSLRVDLLAERQEVHLHEWAEHQRLEAEFQRVVLSRMEVLTDIERSLKVAGRIGGWLLAAAVAVGGLVTWTLHVWQQVKDIGAHGP